MNIVLILTTSIFAFLVLISAVYFLVYFQHPDDKWTAWGPKVIVVLGVSLCCFNVLLLPLDVANQNGEFNANGGIPMETLTLSLFVTTIIMSLAVVPFVMFYYEGQDEKDEYDNDASKQIFYALQWCFVTLALFFLGCSLLWYYYGMADFAIVEMEAPLQNTTLITYNDFCPTSSSKPQCFESTNITETVDVSYIMYMVALASLIGWILFAFFGGVGLAALPFDLLLDYKHRPKRISLQEYAEKKRLIGEQSIQLLKDSQDISVKMKEAGKKNFTSKKVRKLKKAENEFKRDVLYLESQYFKLEDSYKNGGGNPLVHWAKLFVGIIGTFLSLFWFIHILIYVLPVAASQLPPSSFLNVFFESTGLFPFFGIVFYGLFSFWLMLCVMKGTIKMGVRFLIITIHPVKMGETMMSSLVFNVGLMLFSSMAVTQFCTFAFAEYARYTAAVTIFGSQLQNLRGLMYVYSALMYVLPVMTVITILYIWAKPHDKMKPIV